MKNIKHVDYLLALHNIEGLGPIRLKALLDYFEDPKIIWEASQTELLATNLPRNVVEQLVLTRKTLDPAQYAQSMIKDGISWVTIFDDNYPALLKEISDPPVVLYYKGEITVADKTAIAVVGSRKMTGYGSQVTQLFTKNFVAGGLTIISGLARGVDTVAHQIAVEEQGRTIAILGGGIKKIFPPENNALASKISSGFGAVMSEFPPDASALPGNFPARNRIISGMSLAVVVIEAAPGSGSLITAKLAAEQGREVYAVPGPITSVLSHGPIELIRQGAKAVYDPSEILEELGVLNNSPVAVVDLTSLTEDQKKIWDFLENNSEHIDEISRKLNLEIAKTAANLIKMEISGIVKNLGSGIYCRNF